MEGYSGLGIRKWNWVAGLALVLGLWLLEGVGQGQETRRSIGVTVNKSEVFRLEQRARTVSVTQPEIAEVVVLTPTQILLNGKSVGSTSLVVVDERGRVVNYDLTVTPDIAALQRQLQALFPEERIEISTSGPAIVLKGEVSNEVIYDKVLEIARSYLPPTPPREVAPPTATQSVNVVANPLQLPTTGTAFAGGGQLAFVEESAMTDVSRWGDKRRIPGIIDLLVIVEFRQIQLNVIVAEVSLTKLREMGVDILFRNKNTSFSSLQGSLGGFPTRLFEDLNDQRLTFGDATSGIFSYVTGSYSITALYRLFQNKDVTEILAQPNLVIKNGRSGGFLAGGEFPVARSTEDQFEVQFKPFGVRLDFIPTLTWSNTIDLQVFPEVSEIDQAIQVQGIPGLRVRRSVSRVEMKEGEMLVMSGLLDRRILRDLTKVPFLGDLPILGALFRTTRFRNQETELVFVVTPQVVRALPPGQQPVLPSIDKRIDPDIRQVPQPTPPAPSGVMPPSAPLSGGEPTIP